MATLQAEKPANSAVDDSLNTQKGVKVQKRFEATVQEGGKSNDPVRWAVATAQGRRPGMEDAHTVLLDIEASGSRPLSPASDSDSRTAFFGVFDGHAGSEVAAFAAQHLPGEVMRSKGYAAGDLRTALRNAFLTLDEKLKRQEYQAELYALRSGIRVHAPLADVRQALTREQMQEAATYGSFDEAGNYMGPKGGSTAVVALVRQGQLTVASVGDSRCVLCVGGQVKELTHDHKPDQPNESARIYSAGDFVAPCVPGGVQRVGGSLAMSRALGDVVHKNNPDLPPTKQAVTAEPDTTNVPIGQSCDFMVLACDGVWDVITPEELVRVVKHRLQRQLPPSQIVQEVVDMVLDSQKGPGPSRDNVTFMLVLFREGIKA